MTTNQSSLLHSSSTQLPSIEETSEAQGAEVRPQKKQSKIISLGKI